MVHTKEIISRAFWELLEEKPYSKITVQNIVERCQVNRNTFYYHFTDIPALVEYAVKEWSEATIRESYYIDSADGCLILIAQECTKRKKAALHLYKSVHREAFMYELNRVIRHLVEVYVDERDPHKDMPQEDREILIWFYKCTFFGIALDWLDAGMDYDLAAYFEKLYASFGTESGLLMTGPLPPGPDSVK